MDLSDISTTLYEAICYLAVAFIIFYLGKLAYQLLNKDFDVKDELVEKDNLAFALAHTGYFIGLLLSIGSAIVGPSNGLLTDIIDLFLYGILAIILLNLSILINDKIILSKFSVKKEIVTDRNSGAGIIEAAVSIASGLIIFGSVSGEITTKPFGIFDNSFIDSHFFGVVVAIIFWAFGQIALIIASKVYQLITPYDIFEQIEKDNVAVGIGFSGALIAISNLICHGISGDFESWKSTFAEACIELLIGLILLPLMRFLTDKILLPGERLTDEIVNQEKPNIGAAIIEAFAYIGGSVLISWCL